MRRLRVFVATVGVTAAFTASAGAAGNPFGVDFHANCTGGFADETVTIVADSNPTDGLATAVSSTQTLNSPAGSFLSFQVIYNGDSNYDPSAASICEPLCAFPFVR